MKSNFACAQNLRVHKCIDSIVIMEWNSKSRKKIKKIIRTLNFTIDIREFNLLSPLNNYILTSQDIIGQYQHRMILYNRKEMHSNSNWLFSSNSTSNTIRISSTYLNFRSNSSNFIPNSREWFFQKSKTPKIYMLSNTSNSNSNKNNTSTSISTIQISKDKWTYNLNRKI